MAEQTLTNNNISLDQLRPYYINDSAKISRSTRYYDYVFQQILDGKRSKSNWAAGFMSTLWTIYRRQYELAFVISLIFMVVATLETLLPQYSNGLSLFLGIVLLFVLAFKGNTYYFNAIKKKIETGIKPEHPSNNIDKQGTCLLLVFFITTFTLSLYGVVGVLLDPEIISMAEQLHHIEELSRKYLKINWIAFVVFWGALYIWRIHPEKAKRNS
ncbi:DUF2628 domain-containing protein [Candidatus Odyssella acanthamoebae]|uniref:DUF2628 domain-containing protein n=1 Tax=Candidatus Odyssella acanthamoebae TaxID=91604 RepID=A0A077AVL7_9PROT|nr:DUF2628 domain-containing protein [Candidatus Paracaedibacter acanthamoebae]AIK96089.1 hypothetical protein ID47_04040 [Candidatus Paracaedibacter acanthamoebae]